MNVYSVAAAWLGLAGCAGLNSIRVGISAVLTLLAGRRSTPSASGDIGGSALASESSVSPRHSHCPPGGLLIPAG